MPPIEHAQTAHIETTRHGLAGLISATIAWSFGIAMLAAVVLLAAGVWLERS